MSDPRRLIGKTLSGHFFLREYIASGGMADVYLAWDNSRAVKVAIKVIRPDLISDRRAAGMFRQEADFLAQLSHPHIVRLYEFMEDRQMRVSFLVMEWIDGPNLEQAIKDRGPRPYSPAEVSQILNPVCTALNYAHQKGIFHCDVKPANVLLDRDGRVVLTDLGVARIRGVNVGGGTASYMAPEQLTGQPVSAQTDVYALGVVLYVMLTGGKLPFDGTTPNAFGNTPKERVAWEHVHQPAPPPRMVNSSLPPAVDTAVLTALNKHPRDRYRSTMELYEAFEKAQMSDSERRIVDASTSLQPLVVPKSPPPLPPPPPPPSPLHGPYLFCINGQFRGQNIGIPVGELHIGRGTHNQVRLTEASISRAHMTIVRTQRGVYVCDQGSSFGTFVNGCKIPRGTQIPLKNGDTIQIGHQQIFEFREK